MSFENDEDEVERHESFGMVGFNRIHGGGKRRLFGSPLRDHASSVILRIHGAHRRHGLSEDKVFADKELIEIELTSMQFATLLTTLNVGDGVPCTIRHVGMKRLDPPPEEEIEVDRIRAGFSDRLTRFHKYIRKHRKRLEEIVAEGRPTKGAMKEFAAIFEQVEQEVASNWGFVVDQFEEATDRIANVAKAEVDAFVTGVVQRTGLEELKRVALAVNETKALPAKVKRVKAKGE